MLSVIVTPANAIQQDTPRIEFLRTLPPDDAEVFFGAVSDMDVRSDGSTVVLDGLSHSLLFLTLKATSTE